MALSETQHYGNALHCYCRLRDLKVPKPIAMWIGKRYESLIHRILYRGRK